MNLPLLARLGVALGIAASLAYLATPVAMAAARRFAFYDLPAGYKGHAQPTPYLGGTAVMVAFALAILVGAGNPGRTLPLLGGVAVLAVVGTVDDRRNLSPGVRVAIELVVGALISVAGLGWKLGAGAGVDAAVTAVWVVAVVNAFNLFDNMDGAASTMALVAAGGACGLALVTGDTWVAAAAAALCGACLGFLPHNLASPARIFLGDGGSMPLGFIVAALVASAAGSAEPSSQALLVGLLLVGIPVLDTCLVVVSRRRRGVPVLSGGRDHLTHRTRRRMRTARRVAVVLGSAQAVLSALVIFASRESSSALVFIVLGFIVCAVVAIVGLESTMVGEEVDATGQVAAPPVPQAPDEAGSTPFSWLALALVAVLGLGAGISPLFSAYYDTTTWISIGLCLVIAAAAGALARPPRLTRSAVMALAGLAGLGLWSLLSSSWGHNVELATKYGNEWLSYAALLLLLVVLLRRPVRSTVLLGAAGLGITIVAVSVVVRLLGADPGSMFIAGRLNSPLGYINGEGCVFAMGCWFSLALAERREPPLAGLGAGLTVVMAGLTLLSQSRGAAIATAAALLVALVAIPGVRRRLLALAAIAVGFAVAAPALTDVYSKAVAGVPVTSDVHSAAGTLILAAAVVAVVWGLLVAVGNQIVKRGEHSARRLATAATVAAALVVAVPVIGAAIKASSIEHAVRSQWHAFVNVGETPQASSPDATSTRLFSGSGNRYDYWRVAWSVFKAHPLAGVGAGGYAEEYFRQRHTTEAIQNPHSIELQILAELGLIGAALFATLLAGIVLGGVRMRAAARTAAGARTAMVAASGAVVVWLVDTSGDWMHLLPGVSAVAIAGIAVLCTTPKPDEAPADTALTVASPRRARMLAGAAVMAFVLAVAGASLLRSGLARRYLDDARAELRHNPAAAITDANRSLRLDSANLDAYYVKAAGLARFDRAAAARDVLLAAIRQDANNFVTWTLLGDLEVRTGNLPAARAAYSRAHALDPRDPAVAALAADPSSALRGS